jgi:hypothetical protein
MASNEKVLRETFSPQAHEAFVKKEEKEMSNPDRKIRSMEQIRERAKEIVDGHPLVNDINKIVNEEGGFEISKENIGELHEEYGYDPEFIRAVAAEVKQKKLDKISREIKH